MKKWEYCYIDSNNYQYVSFSELGMKKVKIKRDKENGGSKEDAIAKMIAKLGIEGWELTNTTGEIAIIYFFKREIL